MTNSTTRPQPLECGGAWWGLGAANARSRPSGQAASSPADNGAKSDRPDWRVSDTERQATADHLKAHFVAGRLDIDEYEERLQRALAARTRRDLDDLVGDLPSTIAVAQPPPPRPVFVPVLLALAVFAVFTVALNTLHWFFFPWWLIPIVFFVLSRRWRHGWRPVYSGPSR